MVQVMSRLVGSSLCWQALSPSSKQPGYIKQAHSSAIAEDILARRSSMLANEGAEVRRTQFMHTTAAWSG